MGFSAGSPGFSAAFAASGASPPNGYTPMSALIEGDSVNSTFDHITDSSGNPISLEQFAAQKAGYTVTVVTVAQWDAMSAADFAKYQLLIGGCSSNASVWAPVVMGTSGLNTAVGNRTLLGTDPEEGYQSGGGVPTNPADPTTSGAEQMAQDGITYAGEVSGATGIYTGCTDASVLNMLSVTHSGFTEDTSANDTSGNYPIRSCSSVQLISFNPAFASLTDTGIKGWDCSAGIAFPTYPGDWQPLAVATEAQSLPTCGPATDVDGATVCGEAYILTAGQGIAVNAPDLSMTPATGSDPVGGTHTVTATDTFDGSPLGGPVSFQVTGQNAGASGTCVPASCKADANGNVTFTYSDTNGAGNDMIIASSTRMGGPIYATTTETWTGTVTTAPTTTKTSLSGVRDVLAGEDPAWG